MVGIVATVVAGFDIELTGLVNALQVMLNLLIDLLLSPHSACNLCIHLIDLIHPLMNTFQSRRGLKHLFHAALSLLMAAVHSLYRIPSPALQIRDDALDFGGRLLGA